MLKLHATVWGVKDIQQAVAFWSAALDYRLQRPADDAWAILIPKEGEGVPAVIEAGRISQGLPPSHGSDVG